MKRTVIFELDTDGTYLDNEEMKQLAYFQDICSARYQAMNMIRFRARENITDDENGFLNVLMDILTLELPE